jgi:negative regulator of flagellin synthesis FlgM
VPTRIKDVDGGSIGAGGGSLEPVRGGKPVDSATSGSGSTPGSAADSVHITDSARALAALSQAIQAAPDMDSGRVATLQQAIANGSYSVDPGRIANRMLQFEQDVGSSGSGGSGS